MPPSCQKWNSWYNYFYFFNLKPYIISTIPIKTAYFLSVLTNIFFLLITCLHVYNLISLTCFKIIALFVNLLFLGQAFTIMLVYVWCRRNPYVRMNFFGILDFRAPYLPWVLLAFSVLLGNSIIVDLIGNS